MNEGPNICKPVYFSAILILSLSGGNSINAYAATNSGVTKEKKVVKINEIKDRYNKMVVGEKNISSAMSVIGKKTIKNASSSASIYSMLRRTPSVNEYQQNIGPGLPVLTIRGVPLPELAQTLDGVPMTSILNGGQGSFYSYNVGSIVSTGQIEGIHVYPGSAPPDREGFATIGGTINFKTKKPKNKFDVKIFSKIGSFSTDNYGLSLNSGSIPGSGGLKIYTRISRTTTDGYIQHTPAKYTDLYMSLIKPYDYGLSHVSATFIYNNGIGNIIEAPVPTKLQNENGLYYNFPLSTAYSEQKNKYLTAILGDSTYINRHLVVGGKVFLLKKTSNVFDYTNPDEISTSAQYQVNFETPYFPYGPVGPGTGISNHVSYNPSAVFGTYPNGMDYAINKYDSTTIGITPKVSIFLKDNTIILGGLVAKEAEKTPSLYFYGDPNMPEINGYNNLSSYTGKESRTVYSGYLQDRISLFNKRLHIEPGVTITGVSTTNNVPFNIYDDPSYGYNLSNYDKVILPYIGFSYDINKAIVAYFNFAKDARFAPLDDYELGPTGSNTVAPGVENANSYTLGIRYVSNRLYLNFDGYIQNMTGMYSSVSNAVTGFTQTENIGDEQRKGLEFSGKYRLNKNILLFGDASYTQAKYLNSFYANLTPWQGQFGFASAGDQMAAVPNWLSTLGVIYSKQNFRAQLYGQYTGSQPTTTIDEMAVPGGLNAITVPDEKNRLVDYFILNLESSYKIPIDENSLKYIKLSLNIDNLLDRKYSVHKYTNFVYIDGQILPGLYSASFAGEPRFIEFGISGKFI
ncbi:TonB-dependent receptor [Acidithiobacillus thiooxidans]|uniref:TonB-dependent receptor n=1 Tax=Acidithiobacillus thiooxidans TaxID=930 RepID=UPI0028585254|nr:TonB-dependent receptor [Acidithiobacillus thiooxidans]MDR7926760.1 TonB-dependent receptor [Acidithiobacillus thiooxidans]